MASIRAVKTAHREWQRSKEAEIESGWAFADAVAAYCAEHGRGGISALVEATGLTKSYLAKLNRVAAQSVADDTFRCVSLSTAIEAMQAGIKPEPGMTTRDIRQKERYAEPPTTPSERAARAARDLADPEVQDAALEDPDAYRALMNSAANVESERIRRRRPAEPRGKSSGIALFSLHAEMIAARQRIRNVTKMLPGFELDSEARDGLLADVDTTEDVLRGLRDMLMTGAEFDEGLAALLTEEGA